PPRTKKASTVLPAVTTNNNTSIDNGHLHPPPRTDHHILEDICEEDSMNGSRKSSGNGVTTDERKTSQKHSTGFKDHPISSICEENEEETDSQNSANDDKSESKETENKEKPNSEKDTSDEKK
ncbi:hypothetical protein PMAYCL1PPCAC_16038, partial [Pristionchus mayeri]